MGHHTPASRWGGHRRHRRAIQKSRGSKVRRAEGTMSEPGPPASTGGSTGTTISSGTTSSFSTTTTTTAINSTMTASTTTTIAAAAATTTTTTTTTTPVTSSTNSSNSSTSSSSTSTTTTARQAVPQISVYSGIPDRQTVQVIQQAFHRQPNTAAQYLQQMYAAQQQHLMLQTAALQQQHSLSTAQLQSLAAVQQASIAAGRQNSSQNGTSSQTGSTQATINLTTSPAAAQLISRAQSITSTPTSISQQAVLLGSPSSTALTASQAQMYLRAQMAQQSNVFQAQQSNLVQVARSLGRAVPLSPQLIFTPTATVTAVQSESSTQVSSQNQVQNLAIRGQQVATTSSSQTQTLQALSLKQTPVPIQPASLIKNPSQGASQVSAGGKPGSSESPSSEGGKKGDVTEAQAINMSRSVTALSAQPLIAPAYTQIQPHSLVQQHKQQQFLVHQSQSSQRMPGQLLQTASIQPSQHPVPVLPKPAAHQPLTPSQQATIFHSTISTHALHSAPSPTSSLAKAQPVQLTAINLQIQPTASRMVQDSKDKPTSLVVRETCAAPTTQQQQKPPPLPPPLPPPPTPLPQQQKQQQHSAPTPSQPTKPVEQPKYNPTTPAGQPQGGATTKRPTAAPRTPPPAMTSGNESEAPSVTAIAPHNGENKLPQAIVKPQVLTHVIEGFVIQEGAEPFPVCVERLPILINSPKKLDSQLSSDPDKTPVSNAANSDSEPEDMNQTEQEQEPKLTCEYCGWVDFAYTFKGTKRFCSMVCAKRYNVGCTKRIGLFRPEKTKPTNRWRRRSQGRSSIEAKKRMSPSPQQAQGGSVSSPHPCQPSQEESSPCSEMSSYEEPPSPLSAASSGPLAPPTPASVPVSVQQQPSRASSEQDGCAGRDNTDALCQPLLPNDPTKWNVEEVYEFICSLPGCQEIADEFRSQEIDGQALLLLKEDHLMSTMNIKLGPALKIFARINMLKDS
ncbi:polyhomeotic-like protein 2b isoform X2 [Dunckerocampus dactyliophorus]|uniref:polyhomeotic-like protein 2b isoform X2 n=1 Tax=Dunckerocampus dactyliophorus TaxID=161453 RepID=UPI002404E212|nr:polyhomeotic-like protein 2b isoform X2 [Dunckerocampus dactyliophorus]